MYLIFFSRNYELGCTENLQLQKSLIKEYQTAEMTNTKCNVCKL